MNTEVIRKLTIKATADGVDRTAASLKALAQAQEGVTKASGKVAAVQERVTKATAAAAAAQERAAKIAATQGASQEQIEKATLRATAAQERAAKAATAAAAAQDRLAAAQERLNKSTQGNSRETDTSAKRQLSLAQAVERLRRQTDADYRSQQQFTKGQDLLNRAFQQGTISATQHAQNLDRLRAHYSPLVAANDNVRGSFQRMAQALATVQGPLGPIAGRLSSLGTLVGGVGLGFAATGIAVGVFAVALVKALAAVNALADRAGKMVDFAETTGLTTTQLQALQKAASFVGIEADKVGTGFEKFSVEMEKLRRGSGELFEAMNRIDPALTNQLAHTRDLGEAWDVFSVAVIKAKQANLELANAAARAGFGRQGIPFTRLAGATVEAGNLAAMEAGLGRVNVLTFEQLKRWDEIKDRTDFLSKTARDNLLSIFADDFLETQEKAATQLHRLSEIAKNFAMSDDLRKLINGPANTGQMPGAFEPFGWLKVLADLLPHIRNLQMGGAAAMPRVPSPSGPAGPAPDPFASRFGNWNAPSIAREEFDIARLRQRVAVLGQAAPATLKLALAEAELAQKAKLAGVSQEDLARGIAALRSDVAAQALSLRIGLLGDLATATEIAAQKQREIDLANLAGAKISAELTAELKRRAVALHENQKIENQLAFERAQMGRSDIERRVAETLRGQGIDPSSVRGQAIADQIRFNEQLKLTQELASDALKGFLSDLRSGKTPLEAFTNALTRLSDKLVDIGLNNLLRGALGGAGGFGSMFAANDNVAQSVRQGITQANQDQAAAWRANSSTSGVPLIPQSPGGMGMAGYGVAGLGAVGAGIGAYRGGEATASPTQGALSGALSGGLSGAALGTMIMPGIGTLIGDGAGLVAGGLLGWLGGNSAQRQQEEQRRRETQTRVSDFGARAELAGLDTSTQDGALRAFEVGARRQREEEARAGGGALVALEAALAVERENIIKNFAKQAEEIEKQRVEAVLARQKQFADRTFAASNDTSTLSGAILAFERRAARERADELEAGNEAILDLDRALAAERLQIERDFMERVTERLQTYDDRLFAALTDTSTLEGALAAFDRRAQKDRQDEIESGGQAIVNLELALAAERINVIKDFNDRALKESEQFFTQLARSLTEFIAGLRSGSASPLSPSARLAQAQADYNAQLTLAQGGDRAALGGITGFSSRLIDAARDFFGSASGFQTIFNQIIGQLEALPAIAISADPVVAAIEDQTAVMEVQSGILTATQAQVTATANLQAIANSIANTQTTYLDAQYTLLDQIKTLNATAATQLTLLQTQYAFSVALVPELVSGPARHSGSVSNTIAQALGKIVVNTWATALNTSELVLHSNPGRTNYRGVLQQGGWIGGNSHANGGSLHELERGEFVVRESIARRNPWLGDFNRTNRLPMMTYGGASSNDNSALIRELIAEVAALRRDYGQGHAWAANHVAKRIDAAAESTASETKKLKSATQQAAGDPRNAKAA